MHYQGGMHTRRRRLQELRKLQRGVRMQDACWQSHFLGLEFNHGKHDICELVCSQNGGHVEKDQLYSMNPIFGTRITAYYGQPLLLLCAYLRLGCACILLSARELLRPIQAHNMFLCDGAFSPPKHRVRHSSGFLRTILRI